MLTNNVIHKAGRVDQIVRDYFSAHPGTDQILAKNLMPVFVEKDMFNKDYSRSGLPIRNLLRELDRANQLSLIKHCKAVRNKVNTKWYFAR